MDKKHVGIIIDLDGLSLKGAEAFVNEIVNDYKKFLSYIWCFSFNLKFITDHGARLLVKFFHDHSVRVMIDGKFEDRPDLMAEAAKTLYEVSTEIFTVRASAGIEAMKAVMNALRKAGVNNEIFFNLLSKDEDFKNQDEGFKKKKEQKYKWKGPMVLAETILPFSNKKERATIQPQGNCRAIVQFAEYALAAGLNGIICPTYSLKFLNDKKFDIFSKVVSDAYPGYILDDFNFEKDNGLYYLSVADAVKGGADAVIIGKHITKPPATTTLGSFDAISQIIEEINGVTVGQDTKKIIIPEIAK